MTAEVTRARPAGGASAPPAPVPARLDRLPSLTGLRFFAAFFVFGFHLSLSRLVSGSGLAPVTRAVFGQGATGVSFFFVLSGFVLTWSARPTDTPWRFWRRRAAKIYPNHLVTAILAAGALVVAGSALTVAATVCNLLLLQAWVPSEAVYFGLNTPSWSLSCEAFFYLCFPVLLVATRRIAARWLWPLAVATLLAICLMPAVAQALPAGLRYWFVFVFPPVRMLEFLSGILLARIVREGRWIRLRALPAVVLALAGYAVSGHLPGAFSWIAGTVVPLALLIPAVADSDLSGRYSILRSRAMVWLGEVSFAFYLLHQLVIRFVDRAVAGRTWPAYAVVGLAVITLALALAGSWSLYRFVERPAMARLAGGRRPATGRRAAGGAGRRAAGRAGRHEPAIGGAGRVSARPPGVRRCGSGGSGG